jgi:hypothetical protein
MIITKNRNKSRFLREKKKIVITEEYKRKMLDAIIFFTYFYSIFISIFEPNPPCLISIDKVFHFRNLILAIYRPKDPSIYQAV